MPRPGGIADRDRPTATTDFFSQKTVLSVGYTCISVTSLVLIARIVLQIQRPKKLTEEDFFMVFAYALSVSQCAFYIVTAPMLDRFTEVSAGKRPAYAAMADEALLMAKLVTAAYVFYWTTLWVIKFGLLLLYRKLTAGLTSIYTKVWWSMVVFCGISLIGNYVVYFSFCRTSGRGLDHDGTECFDLNRQFSSLWYSYAMDTVTNIMLIALPLHLTWNLHLPRGQKAALIILFTSGGVCIVIATLRAAQITAKTIKTGQDLDGTWIAVWGMIEAAVAVVIGFCPSFAILIRASRKASKKSSPSGGYARQVGQTFNLQTIGRISTRHKDRNIASIDRNTFWTDVHSSEEELAGKNLGIYEPTTVQQDARSFDVVNNLGSGITIVSSSPEKFLTLSETSLSTE